MTRAEEAQAAFAGYVATDLPLPRTAEGKVNIIGLCRALGLKPPESYAQHFHRNTQLKEAVNSVAAAQDLLPIGARLGEGDEALIVKASEANRRATNDARVATEERAAHEAVYLEVVELRQRLARTELERDGAIARLRAFEEGRVAPEL